MNRPGRVGICHSACDIYFESLEAFALDLGTGMKSPGRIPGPGTTLQVFMYLPIFHEFRRIVNARCCDAHNGSHIATARIPREVDCRDPTVDLSSVCTI
jgi:hypothetical protein